MAKRNYAELGFSRARSVTVKTSAHTNTPGVEPLVPIKKKKTSGRKRASRTRRPRSRARVSLEG